jgi:type IV pilus assembly protein PilM
MLEVLTLKPEAFGLDISDLSLKILKLRKKRGLFSLASFGEEKIPQGLIVEGEIKDEESVAKIIKEALTKLRGEKIKTKYVVASLPEEKAFLQVIQLPKMAEEELKGAVLFEAENYIPLPIDDVYIDFQIVPPFYNHLDHFDVLIAALPKKVIDSYVSVLKKSGLQPRVLEIESLSIGRALVKNEVSPFPTLLIDLGATKTSFIIFSGFSVRLTSSIPVSSQKFTEAIAKSLRINEEKAEELKVKYGLVGKENKEGLEIFEALIPSFTDLLEQIKSHLYYYQSHSQHEHLGPEAKGVSKILLSGGGANLKGLSTLLAAELKIPVEIGNPWVNILPESLKEIPQLPFDQSLSYTTALGLALRGIKE